MVLGDKFISDNAQELGIEGQQINSASVDLAIGNKIILVNFNGYKPQSLVASPTVPDPYQMMFVDAAEYDPIIRHTEVDLDDFPSGIWVRPGVGVLCTTESYLRIPKNVVGQFVLKSSRSREFYQSCMAGYFDNGFHGEGTLSIYPPIVPIFFKKGMKIGQMVYEELDASSFDYTTQPTAKYAGQTGPTASKDVF